MMSSQVIDEKYVVRLSQSVTDVATRILVAQKLSKPLRTDQHVIESFLNQPSGSTTKPSPLAAANQLASALLSEGVQVEVIPASSALTPKSKPSISKPSISKPSVPQSQATIIQAAQGQPQERQVTSFNANGIVLGDTSGLRRQSLRAQILTSLLIPLLIVMVGIGAYLLFALPRVLNRSLEQRAVTASTTAARAVFEDASFMPDPIASRDVSRTVKQFMEGIPGVAFITVSRPGAGNDPIVASNVGANRSDILSGLESFSADATGEKAGLLTVAGTSYAVGTSLIRENISATNSIGNVVVGLKRDVIRKDVIQTIVPLLIALALILAAAIYLATLIAKRVVTPILVATNLADDISMGKLDHVITKNRNDEIGDLLDALERMRVSLQMMMNRFQKR